MYVLECDFAPKTFFGTHNYQLSSLSGVHGFKDFLCSTHLIGSFDGQIYSYGSVFKSKFVHQRIQKYGHYRENPWNHELLTVRGVDCHGYQKMFGGKITLYYVWSFIRKFLKTCSKKVVLLTLPLYIVK